jgi:hypothetical protein
MSSGDLSDTIETAATGPLRVRTDGTEAEQHKLTDLIEADRYLAAKQSAAKNHLGIRFTKICPPGAG